MQLIFSLMITSFEQYLVLVYMGNPKIFWVYSTLTLLGRHKQDSFTWGFCQCRSWCGQGSSQERSCARRNWWNDSTRNTGARRQAGGIDRSCRKEETKVSSPKTIWNAIAINRLNMGYVYFLLQKSVLTIQKALRALSKFRQAVNSLITIPFLSRFHRWHCYTSLHIWTNNPLICYSEMQDLETSPFDHDAGCTFVLLEKNDPKI